MNEEIEDVRAALRRSVRRLHRQLVRLRDRSSLLRRSPVLPLRTRWHGLVLRAAGRLPLLSVR